MKSLTERTEVEVSLGQKGELELFVRRDGMTVNTFSLGREPGIGAEDTLVIEGNECVVYTPTPNGLAVKERYPIEPVVDFGPPITAEEPESKASRRKPKDMPEE